MRNDGQPAARAGRLAGPPASLPWPGTATVYIAAVVLVGLPPAVLLAS